MIKLIIGSKGSGKTKILIDKVNAAVATTKGHVVCIEKGNNLSRQLDRQVRLINAEEYTISDFDAFYGFIQGILAGNYDNREVFIDSILRFGMKDGKKDYDGLGKLLERLYNNVPSGVTLFFTVSANQSELPESVLKFS